MLHNFKVSCSSGGGEDRGQRAAGGFRFPFDALFHNKIADAGDDNRQSPLDRSASSGVVPSPRLALLLQFAFLFIVIVVVVAVLVIVVGVAGYWVH